MLRRIVLLPSVLILAGCGYVGDPLPPALNIPVPVTDLSVVQNSDRLNLTFTVPALTTEQLAIESFSDADLRLGPPSSPFSFETWAASARKIPFDVPRPGHPASVGIPVGDLTGQELVAAVRLRGPGGRWSAWSNSVAFTPQQPVDAPAVRAEPDPGGIRVSWTALPDTMYRIWRRTGQESEARELASVSASEFIDRDVAQGQTYTYTVQARRGTLQSAVSSPATVTAIDRFAPAAPAGLTAVAGVNSIELAWERNAEADLSGYRVYRRGVDDAFRLLVDAVEGIAWSDRQAVAGVKYTYRVTAIDKAGNESEPSKTVDALIP